MSAGATSKRKEVFYSMPLAKVEPYALESFIVLPEGLSDYFLISQAGDGMDRLKYNTFPVLGDSRPQHLEITNSGRTHPVFPIVSALVLRTVIAELQ